MKVNFTLCTMARDDLRQHKKKRSRHTWQRGGISPGRSFICFCCLSKINKVVSEAGAWSLCRQRRTKGNKRLEKWSRRPGGNKGYIRSVSPFPQSHSTEAIAR